MCACVCRCVRVLTRTPPPTPRTPPGLGAYVTPRRCTLNAAERFRDYGYPEPFVKEHRANNIHYVAHYSSILYFFSILSLSCFSCHGIGVYLKNG